MAGAQDRTWRVVAKLRMPGTPAVTSSTSPILLMRVEIAEKDLLPDPAFVVASSRLPNPPDPASLTALNGLEACGRVATESSVVSSEVLQCNDWAALARDCLELGLGAHSDYWQEDRVWKAAAAKHGIQASSASTYRKKVGEILIHRHFTTVL